MSTIQITIKEYNKLLDIVNCAENYLDTGSELTKNRLAKYINELNKQ